MISCKDDMYISRNDIYRVIMNKVTTYTMIKGHKNEITCGGVELDEKRLCSGTSMASICQIKG